MGPVRVALRAGCVFVFLCSVVIPCVLLFLAHSFDDVSRVDGVYPGSMAGSLVRHERKTLDFDGAKDVAELQSQILELERIRASVRNELRVMEKYRSRTVSEVESYRSRLANLKSEVAKTKVELQDAHLKLAKADQNAKSSNARNSYRAPPSPAPIIVLPPKRDPPMAQFEGTPLPEDHYARCSFSRCYDLSRCPLMQPFRVYVYNLDEAYAHVFPLTRPTVASELGAHLNSTDSWSRDGSTACLLVVMVDASEAVSAQELKGRLDSLPHWKGDGANHLVVELSDSKLAAASLLGDVALGRAIVARSWLSPGKQLRTLYDILIPPLSDLSSPEGSPVKSLPPQVPAFRKNLIYFRGVVGGQARESPGSGNCVSPEDLTALRRALVDRAGEQVAIDTSCVGGDPGHSADGEWALCGSALERHSLCSSATFALVVRGCGGISGSATFLRLSESLACGAIPVVIGLDTLPYDSVVDWRKIGLVVPLLRFHEVHLLIRSIDESTILAFRRQGRFVWDTYFRSSLKIVESAVAIVRAQTLHPPPASPDYIGQRLFRQVETLPSIPSLQFQNNASTYTSDLWNRPPGPFYMYSVTPFSPGPVSGTPFANLQDDDVANLPAHIVQAGGITGPYFEHYLLGNRPEEHFTVVLLTYKRDDLLMQALERLRDTSYLAKVLVVWNSPEDPASDLQWPDIGVTIEVVRGPKNSLNNRFLPFSAIETEAVLSIDDDVHLRHDEIQFGFRVWREARDRIVGFPGRFHAWDVRHPGWLYNSNYTCELSMVLTGAAFFHKYYSYLYTYWIPSEVRAIVDEYMNCEDIAMNFLVSHITRKPPLKATTRWTFVCPTCPTALSASDEHFAERHVCMNRFAKIFGYMPLLYTQFRVDSVLFKTRLPSHLEKCYQFI